tara:strand:- start:1011 stop:1277 length:267 start_codon:yes stop_codon:yes gene_type:complete
MMYQFSDSASGPARFVSKDELKSVDLTFGSAMHKGGNKKRMSRLSSNLEVMAETLRDSVGISKEDFFMGGDFYDVMSNKIARGMGFER